MCSTCYDPHQLNVAISKEESNIPTSRWLILFSRIEIQILGDGQGNVAVLTSVWLLCPITTAHMLLILQPCTVHALQGNALQQITHQKNSCSRAAGYLRTQTLRPSISSKVIQWWNSIQKLNSGPLWLGPSSVLSVQEKYTRSNLSCCIHQPPYY